MSEKLGELLEVMEKLDHKTADRQTSLMLMVVIELRNLTEAVKEHTHLMKYRRPGQ
jgi:hypothetical protein